MLLQPDAPQASTLEYRADEDALSSNGIVDHHVWATVLLSSDRPQAHRWYSSIKLFIDIAVASGLLLLTLPIIVLAALLVKITSRGPAFYSQCRVGKNGRPFRIFKIRTMFHNCEAVSGPCWSAPGDPRITRLGKFLRRSHLDELPQLLNVICGQMSLIGPRPERPEFLPMLEEAIPDYGRRLRIRPGVTGLAQVQLPPDTDLESVRRKLAYDVYYIQRTSPLLDLRILLSTVCYVAGMSTRLARRICFLPTQGAVETSIWPPLRISHEASQAFRLEVVGQR